jgi:hypothetical protein
MDQEGAPAIAAEPDVSGRHDKSARGKVNRLPQFAKTEIALVLDENGAER